MADSSSPCALTVVAPKADTPACSQRIHGLLLSFCCPDLQAQSGSKRAVAVTAVKYCIQDKPSLVDAQLHGMMGDLLGHIGDEDRCCACMCCLCFSRDMRGAYHVGDKGTAAARSAGTAFAPR